jgi:hypothetical protein
MMIEKNQWYPDLPNRPDYLPCFFIRAIRENPDTTSFLVVENKKTPPPPASCPKKNSRKSRMPELAWVYKSVQGRCRPIC